MRGMRAGMMTSLVLGVFVTLAPLGCHSLDKAADKGDVQSVEQQLQNKKEDVNALNKDGVSPLHIAASRGRTEVAATLLQNGANVNLQDKYGATPLHVAVMQGQQAMIELLLAKGAEVNAKDKYGNTPLILAAQFNYPNIVDLLISKGAEVNARNNMLWTPLSFAAVGGRREMALALFAHGASLDNPGGPLPLHAAAYAGQDEMVRLLLGKKADPNNHDIFGKTALDYALQQRHESTATILRQAGGKTGITPSLNQKPKPDTAPKLK